MRCAVALCNTDNQCKNFIKGTRFFRFPSDPNFQKIWINACKRNDKINIKNARLCSKHFSEDSYEKNLKYEICDLYSSKNQRNLKHDAVPTLNLPDTVNYNEEPIQKRKILLAQRNKSKLITNIPTTNNSKGGSSHGSGDDHKACSSSEMNTLSLTSSKEICIQTDMDNRDEVIISLKKEIDRLKEENKVFYNIFTPNQIKKLKNPKKRATWSIEDISRAVVIHAAGARAYRLLLKKGYPLPAISTLRAWCKKIKLEPGILKQVFMIMTKTELTNLEKVCVLSFDEMKVRSEYLYDKKNDETLKPYNYVQVAVLRGLFGNWKQPIFYDFDCQMTKKKVFEIIKFAENNGFPVVAMVSDLGAGNRSLHKELNINTSQTWFINPSNENKIHVFADVPHLIKLLRNNFLDKGFILNGKEINKNIIEKLLMLTNESDLNIAYKISKDSLYLKGAERQKVKYATKLFSHTISKAISRCGTLGKFDSENWIECAEFFKDVNDWFDCLNVRTPAEDSRQRKHAFGLHFDKQCEILDKMTNTIGDLRVKGKNSLLPFQKGVLITNTSLKLLFDDMKTRFDIKYILTYRLNQDVLENFFGTVRSKGGLHDHPNPLEFKYRLRSYILGKNEEALSTAANVEQDDTPDIELNKEILLTKECFEDLADHTENTYLTDPLAAELDDISYDGLENLAGYICNKLQKDVLELSSLNQTTFTWVDHLSEGGLKKPSEELMLKLQKLEHIFNETNLNNLLIQKGYLSHLLNQASLVQCSDKIKTLFFRSRMYFRIRNLNKEIKNKLTSKKRKITKIVK